MSGLKYGAISRGALHLAIDMQQLYGEPGEWFTPGLKKVTENVVRITRRIPERTVFTRFIPAESPGISHGYQF